MSVKTLTLQAQGQYLVVDERLKEDERKKLCEKLKLPLEKGVFVDDYEEAIEKNKIEPNLVLFFIKVRLPENQENFKNKEILQIKELDRDEINLISRLDEGCKIFIYSEFFSRNSLIQEIVIKNKEIEFIDKAVTFDAFCKDRANLMGGYLERKPENNSVFDYSFLDRKTSDFVQKKASEIKRLLRRTAQDIFDIGQYLIEVKEQLPYGKFNAWIKTEFGWSKSMALRFMRVATRFRSANLAQIEIVHSALYALAAPSTPEEATLEAIERASEGEKITWVLSKEIVAKHKRLKEQGESGVEDEERSGITENESPINQERETLPKSTTKQEILAVRPSARLLQGTFWQLGDKHQLFCGEPKSAKFRQIIPKEVALMVTLLPEADYSLIPPLEPQPLSSFTFQSSCFDELDLRYFFKMVEDCLRSSTLEGDTIVFNYFYDLKILQVAENLNCKFIIAEPDLGKCEKIRNFWKGQRVLNPAKSNKAPLV